MERFWKWLEGDIDKPRTLGSIVKVAFLALILNLLWCALLAFCYQYFYDFRSTNPELTDGKLTIFLSAVVYAPTVEEMLFRYFPISLIETFINSLEKRFFEGWNPSEISTDILLKEIRKTKIDFLLQGGIISSIIFGLMHGSVLNIFIQGVGGMILWFTFLYCSRLGKDLYIGYFGSVLFHASFNFICVLPLLLR